MNKLQLLKYRKLWHKYSETVYGFDLRKLPPYIRASVPKSEYDLAVQLPVIPAGDGILLINESFPEWETLKSYLVALDILPHSLLESILDMEKRRYSNDKPVILESDSQSEKVRKIIFMFLPELLKAQTKKHI